MSSRSMHRLLVLAVCVACAGCLSEEQRQTINDWLTCEECNAGQRQAAVGVGGKAVPRLAGALHEGPSAQRLLNMERKITAGWRRLTSPRLTLLETLDLYVDNYKAAYQARAALALGDIGRSGGRGARRARSELREAMRRDSTDRALGGTGIYRDDVVGWIGGALAGTITLADGDGGEGLPDAPVATAPTVVLMDAGGEPVRGAPVVFNVASGGGSLVDPEQLTDATGRASVGDWILGPALGANTLTATTPELTPVTFTATAEPPTITSLVPPSGQVGTRVRVLGRLLADPIAMTEVTLNGANVDLFVVSAHRDSVIILMPLAGPAGTHTLVVQVEGTASAGTGWQQVGTQEAGDPANDNMVTAPTVTLPLDAVGTFDGGADVDDYYNVTLAAAATLVIDLDWDNAAIDLDILVLDGVGPECVDGATSAKPEQSVCSLSAGGYWILINDFDGAGTSSSYRLRVREQ